MHARTDSFVPSPETIRAAFAAATSGELVFFVRQCLERGGFDHALALAEALPERVAGDPALGLAVAVARFLGGERPEARASVAQLVADRPHDLNARSVLAEMDARTGHPREAVLGLSELVERYPDYPGAHAMLAALRMPGPAYRDVLRAMHAMLRPRGYLEIGVAAGATLALATTAAVALGVDPVEAPLEHALPPHARVVHQTSDAFFAGTTRSDAFGSHGPDLVFIDGLHRFEQALRDFLHAEAWCEPAGTIVLHDCVPVARATASRERETRFWVGDTWKVVWALARHRPELRLRTLLTPPSGLVVVRRLVPGSRRLEAAFASIVAELATVDYPHAAEEWPEELHVVPNTPAGLAEALA